MGGCLYTRRNYNSNNANYYQDPLLDEYGDPQLGDPVDHGVYHQDWDRPFQDIHKSTDQYGQPNRLSEVFSSFSAPRNQNPHYNNNRGHYGPGPGPSPHMMHGGRHSVGGSSSGMGGVPNMSQPYSPFGNPNPPYQSPPYDRQYSGRLSQSSGGSGSHHSYGRQYSHSGGGSGGGHYPSHYPEHDMYQRGAGGGSSRNVHTPIQPIPSPEPDDPVFPLNVRIQSLKSTYPVIEVQVLSNATVAVLKERICDGTPDKIDPDRQRLVHRGRQLKDHKTMDEYAIQSGHTIMLVRSRHKSPGAPSPSNSGADFRSRAFTAPSRDTLSPVGLPERSISPALSSSSIDSGFNSDDPSYGKRRNRAKCSKCNSNPVGEYIVVPCGHKCLCDNCEANIQLKVDRCPQCIKENPDTVDTLSPISSVVKIKGN